MTRKPKAYIATLPHAALPELQELLARFGGSDKPRGNAVMVRLGDRAVARLDEVVEAGLFGSRSEAAAFLIGAGINAQDNLFKRISKHSAEIKKIRQSLKRDALEVLRGAMGGKKESKPTRKKD